MSGNTADKATPAKSDSASVPSIPWSATLTPPLNPMAKSR